MTLKEYYKQMMQEREAEYSKIQYSSISKFEELTTKENEEFKYKYEYLELYNELCQRYDLKKIAGNSSTMTKALNIMDWLGQNTFYCGLSPYAPNTTENILEYSFGKGFDKAINCANKAILLSDLLMSIKIFALPVWLTNEIQDVNNQYFGYGSCHVVVHVYLPEEEKWVMLDPSFNSYIVDESNNILNVVEILEAYKQGKQLLLAKYCFNMDEEMFKEYYIDSFIITSLGRISIWEGNSYDKRKYSLELYNLLPTNLDYKQFLEDVLKLDIVDNSFKLTIKKYINNLKYISVKQLLEKPEWY